jgi:hypothetical protein
MDLKTRAEERELQSTPGHWALRTHNPMTATGVELYVVVPSPS